MVFPEQKHLAPSTINVRLTAVRRLAYEAADIREEHWVIADLLEKGKHRRTVPMPTWVKKGQNRR